MIIRDTKLEGAFLVEPELREDERGFFTHVWTRRELAARGVACDFAECNASFSRRRGTLRGMHYQAAPHGQAKLVRCTRGSIYDVGIDLRADSPTFRQWVGFELSERNRLMLYLPAEFAHGFQTLEDDTEVLYMTTAPYAPDSGRGVRWDDPAFGVRWPEVGERILIARDREYPDFAA